MGSGYIAQGAMVAEFEEKYSNYLGIYGAIATNSGTSALHLALLSLDIKRGDEVILPTYVCTSLLNAINYVNATPIFVDIDSNDYNLNPQILDNYITKRTKAIIIPHMFGKCADLDEIIKYDIPIIEDCAQSLGAKYKGKKAGSMGLLSICSFYATKMITTGEGGIVASNDEHLLEKMRDLRDYDFKQRYITRYNYKMTDMQASMGINQLKKLSCFISRRKYVAECYNKILTNSSNIKTPAYDNERVYYRYIIQIKKNLESIENYFLDNNIMCRRSINGLLHKYANTPGNFPNAEYAISNTLSIPIYPSLSNEDLEKITIVLKDVAQFGDNYV
jgi:perosamine synthetase